MQTLDVMQSYDKGTAVNAAKAHFNKLIGTKAPIDEMTVIDCLRTAIVHYASQLLTNKLIHKFEFVMSKVQQFNFDTEHLEIQFAYVIDVHKDFGKQRVKVEFPIIKAFGNNHEDCLTNFCKQVLSMFEDKFKEAFV